MFVTWTYRGSGGPDEGLALETLACVERTPTRITMEWRRELRNGRKDVLAARFRPDGTFLGAWCGEPGGTGEPVQVAREEFDPDETQREIERRAAPLGFGPHDVESSSSVSHEVVDTPAGRFRCTIREIDASVLFFKARMTCAYADDPLPLSPIVRMEWRGTGMDFVQEMVAFGSAGAVPSLGIPE